MSRTYKIVAIPNFMTVKTGETVVFRLVSNKIIDADHGFDWEPQWWRANATETGRPGEAIAEGLVKGPIAESWSIKFDQPGRFIIACTAWKQKPDPSWSAADKLGISDPSDSPEARARTQAAWNAWETSLYPQCVETEEAFLFDPALGQTTHTLDPYSALSGIKRYRTVLYQAGLKQFPNPAVVSGTELYQEHQQLLETLAAEIEALTRRLTSTMPGYKGGTDDNAIWERHPITATHHLDDPNASAADSELKLFLAKRIPAVAGTYRLPTSGNMEWRLVDWTNPVDRGRTGEYDGDGTTDYEAVMTAVKVWSNYYILRIGNRYPKGTVSYTIPAGFCSKTEISGTFATSGSTWWDDVDEFLGWVGIFSLIVVGIITLIAPVPGSQLASFAIWAGVAGAIAGAAQGAIHLAEQYQDDFNRDWKDEAIDVLSIAGCLFGVGTSWARGAAIKGLIPLRTARGIFYGSIGVDVLTGVVIADAHVTEMESLMNNSSISPDQKLKRLMMLFAQLAGQSALLVVNVKANAKELAHFNSPQPKPPAGNPDPTPAERLKKFADPSNEIDVSQAPKINGHTDEGQHTTIIRDDPYRSPIIEAEPPQPPAPPSRRTLEEALKDKKAWWDNIVTETKIELDRRIPLSEKQRTKQQLQFKAELDNGYIHVEMVRTSVTSGKRVGVRAPDFRADELYPWMFKHFEETAKAMGASVKGIHGEFALDNLRGVEEALLKDPMAKEISAKNPKLGRNELLEAMPPERVAEALNGAPSWKYWKQYADTYGYTMKLEHAAVVAENDSFVRQVKWSFALEKKP